MKTCYLSLLFLCIGLSLSAQRSNIIAVHVEGGAKFDVKSNDYSDNGGFSGYQFFVSGLYPMSDNFGAGIGAGVNVYTKYDHYFDNIIAVPVYADFLYELPTSGDFIPYIDLKLGYGIVSKDYVTTNSVELFPDKQDEFNVKNSGGVYVSPSLGILFPLDNMAFSLSLSYDLQRMKAKLTDMSGERISEQTKTHTNTVALRIGFVF